MRLAQVLTEAAQTLANVVPRGVSPPSFLALCKIVDAVHPDWESQLLTVRLHNDTRLVWTESVRLLARGAGSVPQILARAVKADDATLAIGARVAPQYFGEAALARFPLTTLLHDAFVSLDLGIWLDGRLPAEERRSQLEWVRKAYAKSPTRAAAYELALLCSLSDSHLLYRMAQTVDKHRRKQGRKRPGMPGCAFDARYHTYALPKRSGGSRTITAPNSALKRVQRRFLDRLLGVVPLHVAAHGFRVGHSTLTNAAHHVGHKLVVNVDIESCFPSTKYAQILQACRIAGKDLLSARAVRLLTEICSYAGALPTGAPTSPAIANIVLRRVDHVLSVVAARFEISYTRYADDLTFSGDGDVHRILPFVERVLQDIGYTLAKEKINLFRRGRRQMVTGLVVNDMVNLPRRLRRRLRAAVHTRTNGGEAHWHGSPVGDDVILGHLANLHLTQPSESTRLAMTLKAARTPGIPQADSDDA